MTGVPAPQRRRRGVGGPPSIALRTCAPDATRGATWGDTHFARSFARALERMGAPTDVHPVDAWDRASVQGHDVVVQLRGVRPNQPVDGAVNVVWVISHGDDVTAGELDAHDLVLVASSGFADTLTAMTNAPVVVAHQATDAQAFRPPGRWPAIAGMGLVVVENARWPWRRAPRWLMESGLDFALYGSNWAATPERARRAGTFVANDALSDLYATAAAVVSDQWDHMRDEGFVANRVFDVAASGGLGIVDGGPGIQELFGDEVPTYDSREELAALATRALVDPAWRRATALAAMQRVRHHHTFDHRARELLRHLQVSTSVRA